MFGSAGRCPSRSRPLRDGRSILEQQHEAIRAAFPDSRVHIVVGFKHELIMEAFPGSLYVYNPDYSETNTSKSLLRGLQLAGEGGVVWLNGDVVFDPQLLEELKPCVESQQTAICVNEERVDEEEVKYALDGDGNVSELSKSVQDALGEAIGINFVSARDRAVLVRHLEACDDWTTSSGARDRDRRPGDRREACLRLALRGDRGRHRGGPRCGERHLWTVMWA